MTGEVLPRILSSITHHSTASSHSPLIFTPYYAPCLTVTCLHLLDQLTQWVGNWGKKKRSERQTIHPSSRHRIRKMILMSAKDAPYNNTNRASTIICYGIDDNFKSFSGCWPITYHSILFSTANDKWFYWRYQISTGFRPLHPPDKIEFLNCQSVFLNLENVNTASHLTRISVLCCIIYLGLDGLGNWLSWWKIEIRLGNERLVCVMAHNGQDDVHQILYQTGVKLLQNLDQTIRSHSSVSFARTVTMSVFILQRNF